ncbi:MAG TPA: S41 family peptidase [Chitinophagales bacterium]|nr:S41 family peptidase [Chitinophagales bacterium]
MENNEEKLPQYSFRQQKSTNPYAPFIYALVLSFGVLLGFVVNTLTGGKQAVMSSRYDKIEDILNYIDQKYVDTINRTQLMDKTINEMLANLDPHSVYIPAQDVSEANEGLEGNFEGIGIEFFIVQDTITVVTAISGGPSEMVGIKAGDRIIKINDSTVAGIKIKDTDVKHRLRGPKGTKVKVSVLRAGAPKLLDYSISRDKIPLYSIDASYMIGTDIGYIRISQFGATTHQEFVEKLRNLEEEGMKKLIIDLRGNPGGYLQAATSIADELIAGDKTIVYTDGKAYDRQDYKASKEGMFEKGPLVVLIDQGSASASEILSGAIQDMDRGTVIGRTSFGKGLVQEQYDLPDNSAIRLTVARYYTPSGRSIQRSYAKGSEEYYNEIYDRYARGEFVHEDSISSKDTVIYKTSKGRIVYGGGGIRPDIFVPIDTSADNDYFYAVRAFIPEFVYKYSSRNADQLEKYKTVNDFKNGFTVSPALVNEFYQYAQTAGLKRNEVKEKKVEEKVKLNLKAFFAKQIWRMDGYYNITNSDDKVITKAVETLK